MNISLKNIGLIVCLSVVVIGAVIGQEKWSLQTDNAVDFTTRYYLEGQDSRLADYQGELRSFHDFKLKKSSKFALQVTARSVLNIHDPQRNRIWINQAYMTVRQNNLTLQAGKQTIKWGSMSGMSVMDMANRYDYYDFIATDREYLGLWSGKLRYNTGPINWTLHVAESNNRSILHFNNNRWTRMPVSTTLSQDPDNIYSLELDDVHTSTESAKVQLSLEADFDIKRVSTRVFAYRGGNDIPQRSIAIKRLEDQNAIYDLSLKYHELSIYGVSQSTYVNDWNLWYEVGHVINQRGDATGELVADSYWNMTIGVDRMFTFEDPEKNLKWLLQYCNISGADEGVYGSTDLDHLFSNSILTELQYAHNYNWGLDVRAVVDIANQGLYLNPRIKHKISDQLRVELTSDLLLGGADSFWGHYSDNTRVSFQVQYFIQ